MQHVIGHESGLGLVIIGDVDPELATAIKGALLPLISCKLKRTEDVPTPVSKRNAKDTVPANPSPSLKSADKVPTTTSNALTGNVRAVSRRLIGDEYWVRPSAFGKKAIKTARPISAPKVKRVAVRKNGSAQLKLKSV